MFPRERMIASQAKYEIPYLEDEPTEALTQKLAQFYANYTLLKQPITPADQAEAIFLLLTNRLRQTTGRSSMSMAGCTKPFYARARSGVTTQVVAPCA